MICHVSHLAQVIGPHLGMVQRFAYSEVVQPKTRCQFCCQLLARGRQVCSSRVSTKVAPKNPANSCSCCHSCLTTTACIHPIPQITKTPLTLSTSSHNSSTEFINPSRKLALPNLRVTLFTFKHLPWIHFLHFTHNRICY